MFTVYYTGYTVRLRSAVFYGFIYHKGLLTLVGKLEDIFGPEQLRDFCVSNEINWIIRRYFTVKHKEG